MRQLRLIPSGVQKWHRDTIATTNDAFAYSSTMALHIFRLRDNTLHKMIAAHERTICAICWCPDDSNLLASCSISKKVVIWGLENEEECFATMVSEQPLLMDWATTGDKIALALADGQVLMWEYRLKKDTKLFSVGQPGAKVLRWHPRQASQLLVGAADGALHLYSMQTQKRTLIVGKSKTSKDPVTDAQWDPLSEDYLLVAFQDGSLSLYDASSQREIHTFDIQSQPVKSVAWAKAQPGNFVTVTDRVGVLRIWNVSQRSPLGQIKVGTSGVNCIKAFPSDPNLFMLSFKNSSVGVCDIGNRTMRFMSSPGHSETIFDVVFHPNDPDMLATASYDGYVKLWRISTSENHREMFAGKDQLLYGLAFGPGASRICAVSSTGFLFIWRTDTGEQILKQQIHNGKQAYRCEWNQRPHQEIHGEIVTGGADGVACLTNAATGNVVMRLTHPDQVVGVAWHPSADGMLATACQDGNVRIFNILGPPGAAEPKPLMVLSGHESRVFNIAFHPVCPDLIASGSDDLSIRIWNCNADFQGQEIRRLTGHTNKVRGLLWHSELPFILFSGSWDATIRVWDVATQRCVHVCYEHHADVYGIALHPQRPFFLVSSSRDTTLRFWILEDQVRSSLVTSLVQPWRLAEMLGGGADEILSIMCMPADTSLMPLRKLYGQASRALATAIQQLPGGGQQPLGLEVYRQIVSFFMYRQGIEDLWGLLAAIRGEAAPVMGRAVFHERELIEKQRSKANELASARGALGIAGKQEERLVKAAQIMLRIGDLHSYCRFMARAGHWEKAICIAPAVSQHFWSELCSEYIETLSATADLEECAPFWVATGKASRLVDACIERSELDTAFVVAKAEADGKLPQASPLGASGDGGGAGGGAVDESAARAKLDSVAATLAARYAEQGEPLQAAMCFLAVSQVQLATSVLSRAHEAALSYVVAVSLGQPADPVDLKLLAQCVERDQRWDIAGDLLRVHPGANTHLQLLAARCPEKELAQAWAAWTPQQYQEAIAGNYANGNIPAAVLSAVCAGDYAQAAQIGAYGLFAIFQRTDPAWTVEEARAIMDPLEDLPLQDMEHTDRGNILACAAYVGLVEARNLGYTELIVSLAQTLKNIVAHHQVQFPVSMADVSFLEATAIAQQQPSAAFQKLSELLASPDLPGHLQPLCKEHAQAIQAQVHVADGNSGTSSLQGLVKMAGGHLPTCYKRYAKKSALTDQIIKGPAFEFDDRGLDRKTYVSLREALGWARVNVFSPLNTGRKIYPV